MDDDDRFIDVYISDAELKLNTIDIDDNDNNTNNINNQNDDDDGILKKKSKKRSAARKKLVETEEPKKKKRRKNDRENDNKVDFIKTITTTTITTDKELSLLKYQNDFIDEINNIDDNDDNDDDGSIIPMEERIEVFESQSAIDDYQRNGGLEWVESTNWPTFCPIPNNFDILKKWIDEEEELFEWEAIEKNGNVIFLESQTHRASMYIGTKDGVWGGTHCYYEHPDNNEPKKMFIRFPFENFIVLPLLPLTRPEKIPPLVIDLKEGEKILSNKEAKENARKRFQEIKEQELDPYLDKSIKFFWEDELDYESFKKLMKKSNVIILRSPTGTGKTSHWIRYIKEEFFGGDLTRTDICIIILSTKRAYADWIEALLNDPQIGFRFENYQNLIGKGNTIKLSEHPLLIMSPQSWHNIDKEDLSKVHIHNIFFDESESGTGEYNSSIIQKPRKSFYRTLETCAVADQVLFADAHLDKRTIMFARYVWEKMTVNNMPLQDIKKYFLAQSAEFRGSFFTEFLQDTDYNDMDMRDYVLKNLPLLSTNIFKNISILYCSKGSFPHHIYKITHKKEMLWKQIVETLRAFKTFIFPTNSLSEAEDVYTFLTHCCGIPKEKILLITKDTKTPGIFENIDENWQNYWFIIYSPSLSIGVSQNKCRQHVIIGYFTSWSNDKFQACQQLDRPREPIDRLKIIYMDNTDRNFETDPEKLHEAFYKKEKFFMDTYKDNDENEISNRQQFDIFFNYNRHINEEGECDYIKRDKYYDITLITGSIRNESKSNIAKAMKPLLMQTDATIIKMNDSKITKEESTEFYKMKAMLKNQMKIMSTKNATNAKFEKSKNKKEISSLKQDKFRHYANPQEQRYKLFVDYNLTDDQLDDEETVQQCINEYKNGLHIMIKRLKILLKKNIFDKKIKKTINNMEKAHLDKNDEFGSYFAIQLEDKDQDKKDINIVTYVNQFIINTKKQQDFLNNNEPISNEEIENNLSNIPLEILNEMNQIYEFTPELKQADPGNLSKNIKEKKFRQEDISQIKALLGLVGLSLIEAGNGKKKWKLQITAFIDENLNFKKVIKKRKDNSLVRWQNIDNLFFKKSEEKWQKNPEKYIKKIESSQHIIVCFCCFRKNVTIGWS
jgi:hypothetical protein